MKDYFIYNNVDSRDFGLFLANQDKQTNSLSPGKKSFTIDSPSINGKLLIGQKWLPRKITFKCVLYDTSESNKNNIMSWLGQKGQKDLIISYENYKTYKATFENEINLLNYLNGGIFKIEFIVYSPIAKSRVRTLSGSAIKYNSGNYYNTGLIYGMSREQYEFENITTTTEIELYNGGNVDRTKPVINIDGSATDITITQYTNSSKTNIHREFSYGTFSGNLVINGELSNVFLDGELNNETFEGRYLDLFGKTQWDYIDKGYVDNVDLVNNQITLDSKSSDIDDYYNDYVLILRKDDNIVYYLISDYDGTTKIADITGGTGQNLALINSTWQYSIYDRADGLNYITISGTDLNLTTVGFDFNFLYL